MKKSDLKRVILFLNETKSIDLDYNILYEEFNNWDECGKENKTESNKLIKKEVALIIKNHNIINTKEPLIVCKKKYLCYFLKERINLNLTYQFISELIGSTHRNVFTHVKTAKDLIEVNDRIFMSYIEKLKKDLEQTFKNNLIN